MVGEPIEPVTAIHDAVDREAKALADRHGERLTCHRGCHSCCKDELTVMEVEADRIRTHHQELLAKGVPHPVGACAFLDSAGASRIYANRPYVCRTQGLPLRWLEPTGPDEGLEYRDICPLNEAGTPVELLPPEACWTLGPTEDRLRQLQAAHQGNDKDPARVPLRSLFAQVVTT
jgi:hypothetical protein